MNFGGELHNRVYDEKTVSMKIVNSIVIVLASLVIFIGFAMRGVDIRISDIRISKELVIGYTVWAVIYYPVTWIMLRVGLRGFLRYFFALTIVPLFILLLAWAIAYSFGTIPGFSDAYETARSSPRDRKAFALPISIASGGACWLWYKALMLVQRLVFDSDSTVNPGQGSPQNTIPTSDTNPWAPWLGLALLVVIFIAPHFMPVWQGTVRHPDGQGTATFQNGWKYIGEFKNGEANGQGIATHKDGWKYVGEFKNGDRNGQGTSTWPDGGKYVGEFKDGKYNGQGTAYRADGTIMHSGSWKNGVFVSGE